MKLPYRSKNLGARLEPDAATARLDLAIDEGAFGDRALHRGEERRRHIEINIGDVRRRQEPHMQLVLRRVVAIGADGARGHGAWSNEPTAALVRAAAPSFPGGKWAPITSTRGASPIR